MDPRSVRRSTATRVRPARNDDNVGQPVPVILSQSTVQAAGDEKPEPILAKRKRVRKEERTRKVTEKFKTKHRKLI